MLVGAISLKSINSSTLGKSTTVYEAKTAIASDLQAETIRIADVSDGFLSTDLGNLSSLRTFGLIDTSIKGTLPSEIGKLSNLGKSIER